MPLPTPTPDLVKQAVDSFDADPYTALAESAIHQLVDHFPRNDYASQVVLKVVVINQLYSARVDAIHIEPLSHHIANSTIDELLVIGSPDAVSKMSNCSAYSKRYYSFATKYCNWHKPAMYPMYDYNVDECLWSYRKQDKFAEFRRNELEDCGNYGRFVEIVDTFRRKYGLEQFDFKALDKFLWITGDRILHGEIS